MGGDSAVIEADQVLKGTGFYAGDLISYGTLSPGNSPGFTDVATFEQLSTGTLIIEIEGTAGAGVNPGGWDQVRVTGEAVLDGTLAIQVSGSLSLGDEFEIMTFGSVVGNFSQITGYNLGGGLYLTPVFSSSSLKLVVVPFVPPVLFGGAEIFVATDAERLQLESLLNTAVAAVTAPINFSADIKINEFVHLKGSFTITLVPTELSVDVATGLSSDATDLFNDFGAEIEDVSVLAWTLSATNVQAFVGLNGPYFNNDVNSDGAVGWTFNTGNGDAASRTIDALESDPININSLDYSDGAELPANTIVDLSAGDGWITVGA